MHQEDFNQVLGYRGDAKYEAPQGDGRLRAIARVVREHAPSLDLVRLVRMMTLSAALGNLDMHGKNISLVHTADGEVRLAPMYDVVPQAHREVDQELALHVNGTNDFHALTGGDLVAEAESWGFRRASSVVPETLEVVREFVRTQTPLPGAHHSLVDDIERFSSRLLDSLSDVTPTRPSSSGRDDVPFPSRTAPGGWGGPVA